MYSLNNIKRNFLRSEKKKKIKSSYLALKATNENKPALGNIIIKFQIRNNKEKTIKDFMERKWFITRVEGQYSSMPFDSNTLSYTSLRNVHPFKMMKWGIK